MEELKKYIRDIPDFPKEGIVFKDITPLLISPEGLKRTMEIFYEKYKGKKIDKIIGVESRGFIFAPALAVMLGAGFIPVRKPGKLPYDTISIEYELEYGTDTLEIHTDAITKGDNILIVDDLIATGGTAKAVADMVKKLGGEIVDMAFLVELSFLNPQKVLEGLPVTSLIKY